MNFLGKDIPALQREWRKRYGVDAPMRIKPKQPDGEALKREYDRLAREMPRGRRA